MGAHGASDKLGRVLLATVLVGGALGALSVFGEGPGRPRALVLVANLASPWGLAALFLGRWTREPRRGAIAGAGALVLGMVAFYVFTPALYLHGIRDIIWTAVALIVGPIMGLCGALTLSHRHRRVALLALAAPSAMLLSETLWLAKDRRAWAWNLRLEPQRIVDVVVLIVLAVLAFLLPRLLSNDRDRFPRVYLLVVVLAIAGAVGFVTLQWVLLHV
ncbi:MAG: hypothetical protein QOG16_572 [Actinomycetota bacterium]|jgi:hypothetical protein|nr:hypothetical protein [Actinomycetota bacterium]